MGTLASGSIDLKSLKVAGEANKYITAIDENGVKVHAANNINLNYTQITSEGMEVFKTNGATSNPSAISVAKFGQTSIIGRQDQSHIKIINNGLSILNSGITLFDLLLDENQQAELQHEYDFGETVFVPAGPGPYDLESYITEYPIITVDNTTFSIDKEFKELENAIDSFTINGYIYNYNLDGTRTEFSVQFGVGITTTRTIGQEYVLKPGHEEETPTEQNTILITIYGRHVANSNTITFYTDSNNELPSSINLLLLHNLKCYKMTGLPVLALGLKERSHVEIDYHSLKLIDLENESYLYISDLRDINGYANVHEFFVSDGTWYYDSYSTTLKATVNSIYKITIDDVETTDYTVHTQSGNSDHVTVEFNTTPPNGSKVAIFYRSNDEKAKAFTIGKRQFYIPGSTAPYSLATGYGVMAEGTYSHAEGLYTKAFGAGSHTEGWDTEARGEYAHAEGLQTKAFGNQSHAEGQNTITSGVASHAEGSGSEARGDCSHASGLRTVANKAFQTAIGTYNIIDTYSQAYGADQGQYAFIIGNGGSGGVRSNAFTVNWKGTASSYLTANSNFDWDTDTADHNPSSNQYYNNFEIVNTNGEVAGHVGMHKYTNGVMATVIGAHRIVNNSDVYNQIYIKIADDGTKSYQVDDSAAFRDALGLADGTANATNNTSYINSGIISCTRKGGCVTVTLRGVAVKQLTARTAIATIPAGYRPPGEQYGTINGEGSSYFIVTAAGALQMNAGSARTVYGQVTYSI